MIETLRQKWMQLLADADVADLKVEYDRMVKPVSYEFLIRPETGMVMVRGRADGTGTPFCLGEMTVTRCMVQVMDHTQGYAMVPGSNQEHARLAAFFDALLQIPAFHDPLTNTLMQTLKTRDRQRSQTLAREISDTKVTFFTLKRGE